MRPPGIEPGQLIQSPRANHSAIDAYSLDT